MKFSSDLAHSNVSFKVKHLGIANVKGRFNKFNADFEFDKDTKTFKSLKADIDVNSIYTSVEKRDEHLRSADFFEVEKFPKMKFVGKKFSDDQIVGELTIKDVTEDITLDYKFGGIFHDEENSSYKLGFSLRGKLNRVKFNVGKSTPMIGESIKISIDIEAIS